MSPIRSVALALALAVTGCVMQPSVNQGIDAPKPHTVQAWGYPSTDGAEGDASYNSLGVDLEAAPPFLVLLPDGSRVASKGIDASFLQQHFAPVERGEKGITVSGIHHSGESKRYWMTFSIGSDGIANHLSLYACGHTMPGLLASADGRHVFDFPIPESGIVRLFGGPVRRGRDFAILGWRCN